MARRDDHIKTLGNVPLFEGLSKKELNAVARVSTPIKLEAGKNLMEEGRLAESFMVILSGKASVRKKGRKVATVGKGAVVGEMALVLDRKRNATVTADVPTEVLVLDRRAFKPLLDEPGIAKKLLFTIAERLDEEATARTVS